MMLTGQFPFRSKAQARFLFATNPAVANKMVKDSGKAHPIKGLPNRAKKSSSSRRRRG